MHLLMICIPYILKVSVSDGVISDYLIVNFHLVISQILNLNILLEEFCIVSGMQFFLSFVWIRMNIVPPEKFYILNET